MSIKSGFKVMALGLIIAIAGSLAVISNLHAAGRGAPGPNERWAGPAIEGTVIISFSEPVSGFVGSLTFAGKCKNQACPEIGVVFPYNDLGAGLPATADDLLHAEVDKDTTATIPNIEACHPFVPDPGNPATNVMRMGVNEVITFQRLDGPDADTVPDRVVAQVKVLFIVPE